MKVAYSYATKSSPVWIQGIIDKATAKKQEDRFENCKAFQEALESKEQPLPPVDTNAKIHFFRAGKTRIVAGESTPLEWSVEGVERLNITGLGNTQTLSGSTEVKPLVDTTYVLKAGRVEKNLLIEVVAKKFDDRPLFFVAVLILIVFFAVLILSKNRDTSYLIPATTRDSSINSDLSSKVETDADNIIRLVKDWNSAHNDKNIAILDDFYGDKIFYYGGQKSKIQVLQNKTVFFKTIPDRKIEIVGNITVSEIDLGNIKCSFLKRITFPDEAKDYPSYLTFTKIFNLWKITTEGDAVTDSNIARRKRIVVPEDAVKGDFNGDGVSEYVWVSRPKIIGDGCNGECITTIRFKDPDIPSFKYKMAIGGELTNLGDLNNNGTDELGFLPSWFTSCWTSYNVYTLSSGVWIKAVPSFSTHCNQWDNGVKPIEIDAKIPGNVLIRFSEHTGEEIIIKTESVKIR